MCCIESSDSDDHFSDAQSGLEQSSGNASPVVPLTRIEKVDNEPRYGEVPGTEAYHTRENDAEPDEIAVIPNTNEAEAKPLRVSTPGGQPIPTTVVEKIDPSSPSHGEVPGTPAHDKHAADAVPDMVVRAGSRSPSISTRSRAPSTPGDLPIPVTRIEKVDSAPRHGEVPGTQAYDMRKEDAEPDFVEQVADLPGKLDLSLYTSERLTGPGPTSHGARSSTISYSRRKSSAASKKTLANDYNEKADGFDDDGFGDDFDDFEEGEDDADFGDFDDGFHDINAAAPQSLPKVVSFVSSLMYGRLFHFLITSSPSLILPTLIP